MKIMKEPGISPDGTDNHKTRYWSQPRFLQFNNVERHRTKNSDWVKVINMYA